MSFKESIIIPLDMFSKCKFSSEEGGEEDEAAKLLDADIPSDIKMKLHSQKKKHSKNTNSDEQSRYEDVDFIVQILPEKSQPFARSILQKISDHKGEISWNENLELVLDGRPLADTNIIELFKLISKNLIITRQSEDVPKGAHQFVDKLLEIGVPRSWITARFPRELSQRKTRGQRRRRRSSDGDSDDTIAAEGFSSKPQKGHGTSWISF
jgi:hypothetical protein